jgi:hypothetical protein
MMAAMGTPTVAPVSGHVEHRGNDIGGLSWWLYGDNGDEYFGTHLSGYDNEGVGWVAAGAVIGYVGTAAMRPTPPTCTSRSIPEAMGRSTRSRTSPLRADGAVGPWTT